LGDRAGRRFALGSPGAHWSQAWFSFLQKAMVQLPSESIEIRRARQDDAVAIRELTRSAYAKWVPLIGREPVPMAADYDRAVREHLIDLLFIDAELTGP
jgi:hypothetical protein